MKTAFVIAEKVDGSQKLEFAYDYMGRRFEKKVFEKDASDNWLLLTDNCFVYDGYKLIHEAIAEYNSQTQELINSKNNNYLWNGEALLATTQKEFNPQTDSEQGETSQELTSSATFYYLTDANKNVSYVVAADGTIAASYEYSPFGKLVKEIRNPQIANDERLRFTIRNPFRFSSEYCDSETELVYYNYRYYNPDLGRWLSRDPIEEEGGLNLYAFCFNNSNDWYDYLGNKPRGNIKKNKELKKKMNKMKKAIDAAEEMGKAKGKKLAPIKKLPSKIMAFADFFSIIDDITQYSFTVGNLLIMKQVHKLQVEYRECLCDRKRVHRGECHKWADAHHKAQKILNRTRIIQDEVAIFPAFINLALRMKPSKIK